MMPTLLLYLICDIVSIFFLYLGIKEKKNVKRKKSYFIWIVLSILPLLFLIIFRSPNVGRDYISVANTYSRIARGLITSSDVRWFGMPLIYFCQFICKIFGQDPFWFYLIIGILTIVFIYKAILCNSDNPVFSLFIFICFCLFYQAFNQSRQILALSIILYSYKYIVERNLLKYVLLILFASIFHNTALIFMPIYFLRYIKLNWKTILLYLFLAGIILVGFSRISLLLNYTKYSIYFDTIYNVSYTETAVLNTIIRIGLLFICLFFKNLIPKNIKNNTLYHIVIICTILQLLTLKYYFFGRLTTYFYAFYIYLLATIIPTVIKKFNVRIRGLVYLIVIIIFIIYHFVYYNSSSGAVGSGYDHYESIFSYREVFK